MNLMYNVLILLLVTNFGIDGRVEVKLELIGQSSYIVTNGSGIINATDYLTLECLAQSPTRWIYNAELHGTVTKKINRYERTYRKFDLTMKELQYRYRSRLGFAYSGVVTQDSLRCEAVEDVHDAITIDVTSIANQPGEIQLLARIDPNSVPLDIPVDRCVFQFKLMYVEGLGYYGRCSDGESVVKVLTYPCETAAYCANTYRKLKALKNICTEKISGGKDRLGEGGWIKFPGYNTETPGVLFCSSKNKQGAQEYFFTAPNLSSGKQEIYFSWNEVQPADMLWIEPKGLLLNGSTFYTGQHVSGVCVVPSYGFSQEPVFIVKFDNTELIEERGYVVGEPWRKEFDVVVDKAGTYEISCLAPVWNSREWATKSLKVLVRDLQTTSQGFHENSTKDIEVGQVAVELDALSKDGSTISTNGSGTVNINQELILRCLAQYPIRWIYNQELDDAVNRLAYRNEWTDRKFDQTIKEVQYKYIAWLQFEYSRLVSPERLRCEAVENIQDAVAIQVTPTGNQQGGIRFTSRVEPNPPPPETPIDRCVFQFTFMYVDGYGYYGRCSTAESEATLRIYPCTTSAAHCATTYRKLKALRNICTEKIAGEKDRLGEVGWIKFPGDNYYNQVKTPGVVRCSSGSQKGAQEYFFTAPNLISGKQEIHFSRNEVQPVDMLWIEPKELHLVNRKFYTGQHIRGICVVPKYGFSFDPVFIVKFNNMGFREERGYHENSTDLTWKKFFDVVVDRVGTYDISCVAPVWDSREWATKSVKFVVRDSISPFFEKGTETVNFYEGEENKQITCRASGDPAPFTEWLIGNSYPGLKVKGDTLTFLKVRDFHHDDFVCKASNDLGYSAQKTFTVNVGPSVESSGINGTVIAISISLAVLAVVVIGVTYFYVKFKNLNKIVQGLTKDEILEFREGKEKKAGDAETSADFIEALAYNNKFELSRSKFQVDTSHTLGAGEYGVVYKGTVTTANNGVTDAAFKTVKKNAGMNYVKALLAELKILIHLGQHDAIVNVIGAWTENLRHGEVFVIVELCDSSLLKFLRENLSGFLNLVKQEEKNPSSPSTYQNLEAMTQFSTLNLIQWGKEIAAGLEFIASKHIVHGDIAARNILLTQRLGAKICDFGLARQLVDYNYIKSEQCPLPWKWMAIESLRQMKFSTKTDVWAFGITLWEIFTLGDIPYPGLAWSIDFVTQVEHGLRPIQPPNAPMEIWNVMTNCWHPNSEHRPTFRQLLESLTNFKI